MDVEKDCDYHNHKCRQAVTPIAAGIPDAILLLEQNKITPVTWQANAFFSILICRESQKHFAFTWQEQEDTITVLLQVYVSSPARQQKLEP